MVRQRTGRAVCFNRVGGFMENEFTAIIERDEDWYIAYCPEILGQTVRAGTKDEARQNLG